MLDDLFKPFDPPDPWPHPACLPDEDLLGLCTIGRGRSSGPGGQHRNKVETEITLTHTATGLHAQAGERRSQTENRRVALRRLRLVLATELRTAVPAGETGSKLWRSRLKGKQIVVNPEHRDYAALLAEALDVIAAAGYDPRKAALRLGCSSSQLTRLVKEHPPAFAAWNAQRESRGQHPLR